MSDVVRYLLQKQARAIRTGTSRPRRVGNAAGTLAPPRLTPPPRVSSPPATPVKRPLRQREVQPPAPKSRPRGVIQFLTEAREGTNRSFLDRWAGRGGYRRGKGGQRGNPRRRAFAFSSGAPRSDRPLPRAAGYARDTLSYIPRMGEDVGRTVLSGLGYNLARAGAAAAGANEGRKGVDSVGEYLAHQLESIGVEADEAKQLGRRVAWRHLPSAVVRSIPDAMSSGINRLRGRGNRTDAAVTSHLARSLGEGLRGARITDANPVWAATRQVISRGTAGNPTLRDVSAIDGLGSDTPDGFTATALRRAAVNAVSDPQARSVVQRVGADTLQRLLEDRSRELLSGAAGRAAQEAGAPVPVAGAVGQSAANLADPSIRSLSDYIRSRLTPGGSEDG